MVFRFPNRHSGIGHGDVYQCQQARELNGAQSSLISNLHRDLVVEPRRCAEAWRAIIGPENADKRLFFRPLRPRGATQVFHFVVRGSVSRAGHIGRRRRAELSSVELTTNGMHSPQCAPSASGIKLIGSCRQCPG